MGYIIKRLVGSCIILFMSVLLIFTLLYCLGDPLNVLGDPAADPLEQERVKRELGLDKSYFEQMVIFVENILHGNFGESLVYGRPALDIVLDKLPSTLELALFSTLLVIIFGIPIGIYSGLQVENGFNSLFWSMVISILSMPSFVFGLFLIFVFAAWLHLLPFIGRGQTTVLLGIEWSFTLDGLKHMILPGITLASYKCALIVRLTRSHVRRVIDSDYIRFARSKGLSIFRLVFVHLLKSVFISLITIIGIEFVALIAYAAITETIFSWPGVGKLLVESIKSLDRSVVVTLFVLIATLFAFINLICDLIYALVDPRITLTSNNKRL